MEAHNDSLYRNILFKALDFAWHYKRLWFLGVFAGLVNSGGVFEVLVRSTKDVLGSAVDSSVIADVIAPGASILTLLPDIITLNHLSTFSAVVVWIIVVAMVAGAFWFFSLSEGALIAAVRLPGDVSIAKRTHDELPIANRLTVANLVTHLALAAILALSIAPLTHAATASGKALVFGLGFIVTTILTVAVTIWSLLVACGIALRKESLREAFKNALQLLRKHTFLLVEAAFFYFICAVLFVMLVGIFLRVLAMVFIGYSELMYIFSLSSLLVIFNPLFLLITIVAILAAFGFLVTFQYAAWANLYEMLAGGKIRTAFQRYIVAPIKMKFVK